MLNLALIRDNPDIVRQALAARQTEAPLDDVLALDGRGVASSSRWRSCGPSATLPARTSAA